MGANLTPHWGLIVFLVVVYAISALMHLDPNIANPGGASPITTFTISALDITLFIVALIAGLIAAAAVSAIGGNWAGGAAFIGVFVAATVISNTWAVLLFCVSVVTFSNLGLPLVVQFVIAAPCVIILTWTILAFLTAVLGIGGSISNG